jgi:uncharacterized membrane protein YqjE
MASANDGGGLRDAASHVLATLLDIGRGRLELIAVEIEEERLRLARLWMVATCTLFLAFVGVVMLAGWIVLLCEPTRRVAAIGGLTAAFLAAALVAGRQWRHLAACKPPLLDATLSELRNDRAALHTHRSS